MAGASPDNPLLTSEPLDSNTQIALHPLVLLTISDSVTRHHVRGESGVVVGALLGQARGSSLTIEHAFPCNVISDQAGQAILHITWFEERLKQYKDVHKQPILELVGWFTVAPESGPTAVQLPIHQQILAYNESPILLIFHPSALDSIASNTTGKLPLTIYESLGDLAALEANDSTAKDTNAMQVDEEDGQSKIRFRSLPYNIDTDETEMIGIDFVAKGGGNATALESTGAVAVENEASNPAKKGKGRAENKMEEATNDDLTDRADIAKDTLTPEDEDRIATLNTRLNSVRMLQSRISLLNKFLQSMPPSYISGAEIPLTPHSPSSHDLPYLRQVNALVTRLSLLTPPPIVTEDSQPNSQAEINLLAQANDVNLTSLLALLGRNIQGAHELGRKFTASEQVKASQNKNRKGGGAASSGRYDFGGDHSGMAMDADYDVG